MIAALYQEARKAYMGKCTEKMPALLGKAHDHSEPMSNRMATVGGEQRPYWGLTTWMAPAGACYLPVTVVPVGTMSMGLPVGIQIVGPYLEDLTTLDIGKHLLEMMGGCPHPPGF